MSAPDFALPVPPLALTLGDPAGVGPMIALSAWQALRETGPAFALVGAPDVIDAAARRAAIPTPIEQVASLAIARHTFPRALPVLPAGPAAIHPVRPGEPDPANAALAIASIEAAFALVKSGEASAIVTNPVAKSVLYAAGFPHPGHTEFLAELCREPGEPTPLPVMMLVGGGLRVALATIHLPLRDVPGRLSLEGLCRTARIVHADLASRFALPRPRLVFSGLNPHAGEGGSMGREEIDIINPAAACLRAEGIDIADARPADTVFAEALEGRFDAVIAMTHDQGLIPVKTLDLWGGVNLTLGLPVIRTSPDHGTAFDAARAGKARPDSLIAALRLAALLAANVRTPAHA